MKVLYDDECDFCRELLLDIGILQQELLSFSEYPPSDYGLSKDEFHVVTQYGVYSGGDGLRYLVQQHTDLPESVINNPFVQQIFSVGYQSVADNRSQISPLYFLGKDMYERQKD
jgi:hypothetical protein